MIMETLKKYEGPLKMLIEMYLDELYLFLTENYFCTKSEQRATLNAIQKSIYLFGPNNDDLKEIVREFRTNHSI